MSGTRAGVHALNSAVRNRPQVTVVTDIPSPYQVELFNAIADDGALELHVIYARSEDGKRPWPKQRLDHEACFLDRGEAPRARAWVKEAHLVVFSGYRISGIQQLMQQRHSLGGPWAFWGERPGFRFAGLLGRFLRRWPMRLIRTAGVPIWGIGEWALEGYREELGAGPRVYINVPYFSDLERFAATTEKRRRRGTCRFLFSGQLTQRKGVDVLIEAFGRLVRDQLAVELHLLGDGPLRVELIQASRKFAQRVVFHGCPSWHTLPDYYRDADFLCVPSRHDGWALVVPEGLAAGLPVIASDRTGAARQLLSAENGWLVPANDSAALYQAMKQAALCRAEHYQCLSTHAREVAEGLNLAAGVARFKQAVEQTLEHW